RDAAGSPVRDRLQRRRLRSPGGEQPEGHGEHTTSGHQAGRHGTDCPNRRLLVTGSGGRRSRGRSRCPSKRTMGVARNRMHKRNSTKLISSLADGKWMLRILLASVVLSGCAAK